MFTFYLYLAFIQTRNVKSLSNKHLRLTLLILIYLTSNYRLTYTTSQKFLNSKILVSAHQACILFDPKYSKNSNILKYLTFKITVFYLKIF